MTNIQVQVLLVSGAPGDANIGCPSEQDWVAICTQGRVSDGLQLADRPAHANSVFSDLLSIVLKLTMVEHLHHGNWQILYIRTLPQAHRKLVGKRLLAHDWWSPVVSNHGQSLVSHLVWTLDFDFWPVASKKKKKKNQKNPKKQNSHSGVPIVAQWVKNLTSIHEDAGSIPGQWVKDPVFPGCNVGCRCGCDPMLLWLSHRLAAAALIQPLVWELHIYALSSDLKSKK